MRFCFIRSRWIVHSSRIEGTTCSVYDCLLCKLPLLCHAAINSPTKNLLAYAGGFLRNAYTMFLEKGKYVRMPRQYTI